jgi:osmotically-inducible protein OsmY
MSITYATRLRLSAWRSRSWRRSRNRASTQAERKTASSLKAQRAELGIQAVVSGHASCVWPCMNKTDNQLKKDIETELSWDPKVNAAKIGVTVDQGAVSLLGSVDSYAEKWAAEEATKRVSGVRTVAHDLTVKVSGEHERGDSEIAAAVQRALEWDVFIPKTVSAEVRQGSVTLSGQANWNYQRDAAERAVRYLRGVVSVSNVIALAPETSAAQVKEQVEAALLRQAKADAKSIHVDVSGGKVTLTGHATSWQAIEDAASAAWAAPGVTQVIDQVKMRMTT